MIEVRHLRIIDAIAQAGTLTAAARRVHLSQPAVSRALAEIETRLGYPLFHREPRGMTPTPECERLLPTAASVLDMLAEVERDMAQMQEGVEAILRLTTECYTCYHWLPAALARFGADHPQVEVRVTAEATEAPLRALLEESVDLAIVHQRTAASALRFVPLFDDEVVVILAPDHPLAAQEAIAAKDFEGQILFLHNNPTGSQIITDVLEPAGIRPARVTTLQLTEAVVSVVGAGMGISAVASWVAEPQILDGSLVARPLADGGLHRTWFAAYRARDPQQAAVATLVDAIRVQLGDLQLVG